MNPITLKSILELSFIVLDWFLSRGSDTVRSSTSSTLALRGMALKSVYDAVLSVFSKLGSSEFWPALVRGIASVISAVYSSSVSESDIESMIQAGANVSKTSSLALPHWSDVIDIHFDSKTAENASARKSQFYGLDSRQLYAVGRAVMSSSRSGNIQIDDLTRTVGCNFYGGALNSEYVPLSSKNLQLGRMDDIKLGITSITAIDPTGDLFRSSLLTGFGVYAATIAPFACKFVDGLVSQIFDKDISEIESFGSSTDIGNALRAFSESEDIESGRVLVELSSIVYLDILFEFYSVSKAGYSYRRFSSLNVRGDDPLAEVVLKSECIARVCDALLGIIIR